MKKFFILIGLVLSFGARADFSLDNSNGDMTMLVYDETISRNGDVVKFTSGHQNNIGKVSIQTYDNSYNCRSHRNSNGFLAPGTLGRSAGDYACDFSSNMTAQKEPVVSNITFQEQESGTVWVKYNEYGMRITATDSPCVSPELANMGYQHTMLSAIPLAKLKKVQDAYSTDGQFATTVIGCWSPNKHSFIAVRKHDQKILTDDNFHLDNTWTKLEKSNAGVKS
jgi:hypothetical protein